MDLAPHLRLIATTVGRFAPRLAGRPDPANLLSSGVIGLAHAIATSRPRAGQPWPQWARSRVRWAVVGWRQAERQWFPRHAYWAGREPPGIVSMTDAGFPEPALTSAGPVERVARRELLGLLAGALGPLEAAALRQFWTGGEELPAVIGAELLERFGAERLRGVLAG